MRAAILCALIAAGSVVIGCSSNTNDDAQPGSGETQRAATQSPDRAGDGPRVETIQLPVSENCAPLEGEVSEAGGRSVFTATFDGLPDAPQPGCASDAWDIQLHFRDHQAWLKPFPVTAHHGPGCESPNDPAHHSHTVEREEGLVFLCRDHMMTTIDGGNYGMIYLTPSAMVDFSDGEALISWDMSTFRSGGRDWIDLWITPYEENLALPLDEEFPDAQGNPRNAIHVRMDGSGTDGLLDGAFRMYVIKDGKVIDVAETWNPYNDFLVPDKARRDTFELRISNGRVSLTMPGYGQTLQSGLLPKLDWSVGVVQFGHHSYNPFKDGGEPNTWHWDNVRIEPAVPFEMAPLQMRHVRDSILGMDLPEREFEDPYLRFSAQGKVAISFDDGATWANVEAQPSSLRRRVETFSSYFVPIPDGAKSVLVELSKDDWLPPPYFARGFTIWSP